MKKIELWKWRVRGLTGKVHFSRYRMTEVDALASDPTAERVPWTLEVREAPETQAERIALLPGTGVCSGLVARGWWRQPTVWG